jgi:hypothetical protein
VKFFKNKNTSIRSSQGYSDVAAPGAGGSDPAACRGTVPMEPPMSNGSMRHQNPVGDFDDTGQIL